MPRKGDFITHRDAAWWASQSEVDPGSQCHNFTGTICKQGYGRMRFKNRSGYPAHRAAYECAYGPFDSSLKVCHRCDNRRCVNPQHMFLGTQQDNLRDMFAKGRGKPRGRAPGWRHATLAPHKLSSENAHASVATNDIVHHIRPIGNREETRAATDAVTPVWRRVTGVPPRRPTRAIVLWRRPLEWTAQGPIGGPFEPNCRDSDSMLVGSSVSRGGGR